MIRHFSLKRLTALLLALSLLCLCACAAASSKKTTYEDPRLNELKDLDFMLPSVIEHIFIGQINRSGKATGFHYVGCEGAKGVIVEGTKTEADEHGIYRGKVEISGVTKSGNRGYSTFFPESFTPQDVVDAINEAYIEKVLVSGNTYQGVCEAGFVITMYLTDDGQIISAFPQG